MHALRNPSPAPNFLGTPALAVRVAADVMAGTNLYYSWILPFDTRCKRAASLRICTVSQRKNCKLAWDDILDQIRSWSNALSNYEQDPEFDDPLDRQIRWRYLDRRQTCKEGCQTQKHFTSIVGWKMTMAMTGLHLISPMKETHGSPIGKSRQHSKNR
jgi:hypothetical protein